MEKTSQASTSFDNGKSNIKIKINEQYIVQSACGSNSLFKIYKGVDLLSYTYVTIYARPYSTQKSQYQTTMKQQVKQKLCPVVKWKGVQKIGKFSYEVEVHQKYGPTLQQIFNLYRQKISEYTLYLLAYQLIKLVQKVATASYIVRNLGTSNVVLHRQSQQNELFLLNTFDVKKKNQQASPLNTKYCSIGAHLGLKACFKDDLESICYILFDICSRGKLMSEEKIKDYLEFKNNLSIADLHNIPKTVVDLYIYIRNLTHTDQISFTKWKSTFKNMIPKIFLAKPYQWISNASKMLQSNNSQSQQRQQQFSDSLNDPPQNEFQQVEIKDEQDQTLPTDQAISDRIQRTTLFEWRVNLKQNF